MGVWECGSMGACKCEQHDTSRTEPPATLAKVAKRFSQEAIVGI
jgi:hypothetical protein